MLGRASIALLDLWRLVVVSGANDSTMRRQSSTTARSFFILTGHSDTARVIRVVRSRSISPTAPLHSCRSGCSAATASNNFASYPSPV